MSGLCWSGKSSLNHKSLMDVNEKRSNYLKPSLTWQPNVLIWYKLLENPIGVVTWMRNLNLTLVCKIGHKYYPSSTKGDGNLQTGGTFSKSRILVVSCSTHLFCKCCCKIQYMANTILGIFWPDQPERSGFSAKIFLEWAFLQSKDADFVKF